MSLPPHERYKEKLFPGSSHSWALAQCEPLERSVAVLDIGSGSGVMGARLRELGFGCVSGVEEDAQARAQTASLYTDVAPLLSCFADRSFGLVLLLAPASPWSAAVAGIVCSSFPITKVTRGVAA